jgi:gentisate 1,2-dioxygenase
MSEAGTQSAPDARAALPSAAKAAMERLNAEAEGLHIWLRTQANAPSQRSWFQGGGLEAGGQVATGRVGANQMKAAPHRWRWSEISPYLGRIADIARTATQNADLSPIEFADRQQFLLVNPGLGGRIQVASTIRCAVSIYNPGDLAPVHRHTPNASRTILSDNGGYTTIEGERCEASRGDLILTPNGTWHDHGNDGATPVIWADILDFPLMEFLDCSWIDEDFPGARDGNTRAQKPILGNGHSARLYSAGGIVPGFVSHQRGIGHGTSPVFHYRGAEIREALDALRGEAGDPYEGITLRFVNPATGASVFPTLDYSAQLLRPGEATRWKRETANAFTIVLDGDGTTEIAGHPVDWQTNDLFVVPNFLWRRHINKGPRDAVLYQCSDRPLFEKIGQYRAQGRTPDGAVVQLVT